jgi:putative nucleotidyltransferase with HDIG domain
VLAWVGIAGEEKEKPVRVAAVSGQAAGYLDGITVSWDENSVSGQGPTGRAIRSGELQIMIDRETSAIYQPWRERARDFNIASSLTVPLQIEGGWRGALMVYANCADAFDQVAIEVFVDLAGEIAHGLYAMQQKEQLESEQRRLEHTQEKLTNAFAAIVSALVAAVDARDPYTAGHEGRVAELACSIASELGWGEERQTALRMAAMVHDIGKLSIPIEILVKPGRLSDEERQLMNAHPETGFQILKDIPFDYPIAAIVRQHHEKLDGSGYPLGLTRNEILPEAQVLAVADIVEAMACDRPYRKAIPLPVVLDEILCQAGKQLDGDTVQACVNLLRRDATRLPAITTRER